MTKITFYKQRNNYILKSPKKKPTNALCKKWETIKFDKLHLKSYAKQHLNGFLA